MTHLRTVLSFSVAAAVAFCCSCKCPQATRPVDEPVSPASTEQWMSPLKAGQQLLARHLTRADAQPIVYTASCEGIEPCPAPLSQEMLWDEGHVVFFRLPASESGTQGPLLYHSPRLLRLIRLDQASESGSELAQLGPGDFVLLRTLPVRGRLFSSVPNLEVFRVPFTVGADGAPSFGLPEQVTDCPEADFAPVPAPGGRRFAYLHRERDGRQRLMLAEGAQPAREVFAEQTFDVRNFWFLPDGRLIVACNPDGYHRPYEVDPATGGLKPFDAEPAVESAEPRIILGSLCEGAGFRPVLYELPQVLDLARVCALVHARNATVNRQRALLAAAAVEAGEARLAGWPSLKLSLINTPEVGVFRKDPTVVSGDFVTEGIVRGMVGLVVPLTEFGRNSALSNAARWRIELTQELLRDEINERLTEAAAVYFEARHLAMLVRLEDEIEATVQRRVSYYLALRQMSEAIRRDLLGAEQVLEGVRSERDYHRRRLDFLKTRLIALCNLPRQTAFELADESFSLERAELPPLDAMKQVALLNHPRVQAAQAAFSRAFHIERAGPDIRPTAYVDVSYGHSRRWEEAVDDYITGILSADIPLASFKARRLHDQKWKQILDAYQSDKEGSRQAVASAMDETAMGLFGAQRDYRAKAATVAYRLEALRVARVQEQEGPQPAAGSRDPLVAMTARFDYLQAMAALAGAEKNLTVSYSRVWREMGLADRLPEEGRRWRTDVLDQDRPSLWLWHTREVLADDEGERRFLELAGRLAVGRLYAYLYSDAQLLAEPPGREHMTTFLNLCRRDGVEVWALLGEPEWLESDDAAPLVRAIDRVLQYNAAFASYEPRLAGVKLDLEPHSRPGWNDNPQRKALLTKRYLALLKTAHEKLQGHLPLWVDCPAVYWHAGNEDLRKQVSALADGYTVMCYSSSAETVARNADLVMAGDGKPVEIGLEFSAQAPAQETMHGWQRQEARAFMQSLVERLRTSASFRGLSLHDYQAVSAYFSEARK